MTLVFLFLSLFAKANDVVVKMGGGVFRVKEKTILSTNEEINQKNYLKSAFVKKLQEEYIPDELTRSQFQVCLDKKLKDEVHYKKSIANLASAEGLALVCFRKEASRQDDGTYLREENEDLVILGIDAKLKLLLENQPLPNTSDSAKIPCTPSSINSESCKIKDCFRLGNCGTPCSKKLDSRGHPYAYINEINEQFGIDGIRFNDSTRDSWRKFLDEEFFRVFRIPLRDKNGKILEGRDCQACPSGSTAQELGSKTGCYDSNDCNILTEFFDPKEKSCLSRACISSDPAIKALCLSKCDIACKSYLQELISAPSWIQLNLETNKKYTQEISQKITSALWVLRKKYAAGKSTRELPLCKNPEVLRFCKDIPNEINNIIIDNLPKDFCSKREVFNVEFRECIAGKCAKCFPPGPELSYADFQKDNPSFNSCAKWSNEEAFWQLTKGLRENAWYEYEKCAKNEKHNCGQSMLITPATVNTVLIVNGYTCAESTQKSSSSPRGVK